MNVALSATGLSRGVRPWPARLGALAVIAVFAAAGRLFTDPAASAQAVADAGPDLVRLLRGMAVIKGLMLAGAAGVVLWRSQFPVGPWWASGYAAALASMAAGPPLIWDMAHVALGAVAVHAGFAGLLLLIWRDPGSLPVVPRGRAASDPA